jgi:transposase
LPEPATKLDARKQSRQELMERRRQVIELHQAGVPVMQIVKRCGLSWSAVNVAIQAYKAGGMKALAPESRGRKQGTGRILTKEQEAKIRQYIFMRRPRYYKLKDALWSQEAVTQLIRTKLGVELTARSVGNYLKRWGITPKTQKKNPVDLCTKDVQHWLAENYSKLEQLADKEGAEIYWMNAVVKLDRTMWESIPSIDDQEKLPNVNRKKYSVVSAVNNQGKLSWAIINGIFGSKKQIDFIKALLRDRDKPIFIIKSDGVVCGSFDFTYWARQQNNKVRVYPAQETNFN